jgi:predicted amidohydrolase
MKLKRKIKLGLGQILVEGGESQRNLERAVLAIEEASKKKCDIILLPEVFDLGWTHPSAKKEAEPIPGKRSEILFSAAKKNKIYVCAGLTEKLHGKVYNSAVFIDSRGEMILKYQKINLVGFETEFYSPGQALNVIDTEFGKIGVNICADNYHDSLFIGQTLAKMGAELILSPSSWTVDYYVSEDKDPYKKKWLDPYSRLASENLVIAGTTCVGYLVGGPYEGKKSIGCSLVVGPKGIITTGNFNEFCGELIVADIEIPKRLPQGTPYYEK